MLVCKMSHNKATFQNLYCMCLFVLVCICVCVCVFWFNHSVSFAVVHVVIGHREAQGPVAHCVLCSSDGHATASPAALLTFCFPSVLMVGRLSSPSSCMK